MAAESEEKFKFTWLRRNKYFATTPLSAFFFIHQSNSKIEIVFWYVIIIVFSVFTVLNVTELVKQYSSGKTVSRMQLGRSSNLSTFPNMVFCVRAKLPELNPDFLDDRPGGTKEKSPYLDNVPLLKEDVDEALGVLTTKEEMMATGQWGYVLLPLLFRYFSAMSITEVRPRILEPTPKDDRNEFFTGVESFYEHVVNRNISDAVSRIKNHATKLGVSDSELFHRFGKELTSFSDFSIFFVSYNLEFFIPINMEPELRLLSFSGGHYPVYCSMAPEHKVQNMTHVHDSHNQLMASASLVSRDKIIKDTYGFTYKELQDSLPPKPGDGDEQFVALLGGELGVHDFMRGSGFAVTFGKQALTHVRTVAVYQSKTNCSDEMTRDHCLFKCKVNIIRKLCGCSPLLEIKANDDKQDLLALCELQVYFHCLNNTEAMDSTDKCEEQCISTCFEAEYRIEDAYWRGWSREPKATIYIYAEESDYPIFVEQYAQTWHSFIGELGGTVDFYLGASVVAFIHLFIYIFKQVLYALIDYNEARKKRKGAQEGRIHHLLKFMISQTEIKQLVDERVDAKRFNGSVAVPTSTNGGDMHRFNERMKGVEKTLNGLVADLQQVSHIVGRLLENEGLVTNIPNGIAFGRGSLKSGEYLL